LRALKKLENEQQPQQVQAWQEKHSRPFQRRNRWGIYLLAGISALIAVLFLANLLLEKRIRSIARNEFHASPVQQVEEGTPQLSMPEPAAARNQEALPEEQGLPRTEPATAELTKTAATGHTIPGDSGSNSNKKSENPDTPPAFHEDAAVYDETASVVPDIPVLDDPTMKMQSISWSKNPHQRLAVISNRIVREGEIVAGYQVVAINLNDVLVRGNGRQWRLVFTNR